jgi:hypothetical protein
MPGTLRSRPDANTLAYLRRGALSPIAVVCEPGSLGRVNAAIASLISDGSQGVKLSWRVDLRG